jgi:hypothetical protein
MNRELSIVISGSAVAESITGSMPERCFEMKEKQASI